MPRRIKSPTGVDSRIPDVPGQLGLTTSDQDVYCCKPDEACKKNASPLESPKREKLKPVQEKRQKFNLKNPSIIQYVDKDGIIIETKHAPGSR